MAFTLTVRWEALAMQVRYCIDCLVKDIYIALIKIYTPFVKGVKDYQPISSNYTIIETNFVNIKHELENFHVDKVDGILYDLGVSSFQFDTGDRGFSYNYDARLDRRMNQEQELTAYEIVNTYSFETLRKIFYEYGEERFSGNIAKEIVLSRNKNQLKRHLN